MPGRKGLFHIVEIVIIALVMFVMIFQISYIPGIESDWSKSRLTVQGRDLLHSIEEKGIRWSDEAAISGFIAGAFNMTQVRYRLELLGAPKESISVGCLCQADYEPGCRSFCSWLAGMLPGPGSPIRFNGFPTEFTTTETAAIDNIYDVMVSSQPLRGMDMAVASYLSADKGFVLAGDLGSQNFTDYGIILNRYFAVEGSGGSPAGSVGFNLPALEDVQRYCRIPRYFSHIPNGTGDFYNVTHAFGAFSTDAVRKVSGPRGMVILNATSTNHPACIASYGASSGLGRTVWVSGDPSRQDDWSVLLTSLILWSSEHRRKITGTDMSVESATTSMYIVPENRTSPPDYNHMFQPMEAVLTLGYLY
jgi:hypothetical protein